MNLIECVLENDLVRLEQLRDQRREPLRKAAEADQDVWTSIYPFSLAGDQFEPTWARIQRDHESGTWIPFAVMRSGECVGMTCFIRPEPPYRSVDIGSTYYRPDHRGSIVNPAAKLLMLGHAFACGTNRVQFGVDAPNLRSRRAMTRLGATEEGTMRQARVTWTGRVFDRVIFSILADEWPRVKANLEALIISRSEP